MLFQNKHSPDHKVKQVSSDLYQVEESNEHSKDMDWHNRIVHN